MESLDFKVDKVIEVIDLVKRLSWGAIPLWFALTLPVFYTVYSRLLPERRPEQPTAGRWQTIRRWFTLPRIDRAIVYLSLALFVIGTFTLLIDQHQKEKIRNNGLRLKRYFTDGKYFALDRDSLIKAKVHIDNLSATDIDNVLELYPSEFMQVSENTITIRDSTLTERIMTHCEKLLDSYLSNPVLAKWQPIDNLIHESNFFPREVAYRLLVDSPHKYTYVAIKGQESILIKRGEPTAPITDSKVPPPSGHQ